MASAGFSFPIPSTISVGREPVNSRRFAAAHAGATGVDSLKWRSAGTPVSGCESIKREPAGKRVYAQMSGR